MAMAWLRRYAIAQGVAADRIAAVGSSAGGHLAAMLATIAPGDPFGLTPELTALAMAGDTRPNAVICYCPVITLAESAPLGACISDFMGTSRRRCPSLYRAAEPLHRVTGQEPPFLFLQGDQDDTTPLPTHAQAMHDALTAAGVDSELHVIRGAGHGYGYGVTTPNQRQSLAHIDAFLGRVFSATASAK